MNLDQIDEPLVPVSPSTHRTIVNPPLEWKVEKYMYIFLFYLIIVGTAFYIGLPQRSVLGMLLVSILTYIIGLKFAKYVVAYRRLRISPTDFRQAESVPVNLRELRREEHTNRKEKEKENIQHIEDALNSIEYHTIQVEQEGGSITITPLEKDKTDSPVGKDSLLEGTIQIYPEKQDETA